MRKVYVLTVAMLAAATLPGTGFAQVQSADRVRILTIGGVTLIGRVTEATADSIGLAIGPGPASWIRNSDIAYLERSTARYSKFGQHLLLTTMAGAGAGGMIGAITWTECVSNEFLGCLFNPESRSDAFMFGATVGAVVAAPVGLLIGILARYDRWEPVDAPPGRRSSFSVVPRLGRGIGLSASLSF